MLEFLVIDDHALVRTGLVLTLQNLSAEAVVYEANDMHQALQIVKQQPGLQLVLTDLRLPVIDGMAGLPMLHQVRPDLPVVVVSAQFSKQDVKQAFDRGAVGFIPKTYSSQQISKVIEIVLAGGTYRPDQSDAQDLQQSRPAAAQSLRPSLTQLSTPTATNSPGQQQPALTERQMQVMALLVQGKSNKVICDELGVAPGTLKIHISSILRALKVTNRTQAVLAAARLGLQL
jgi:DNA-binding NarL/FixJ family response regulator